MCFLQSVLHSRTLCSPLFCVLFLLSVKKKSLKKIERGKKVWGSEKFLGFFPLSSVLSIYFSLLLAVLQAQILVKDDGDKLK